MCDWLLYGADAGLARIRERALGGNQQQEEEGEEESEEGEEESEEGEEKEEGEASEEQSLSQEDQVGTVLMIGCTHS